jgi:hypothetical protein
MSAPVKRSFVTINLLQFCLRQERDRIARCNAATDSASSVDFTARFSRNPPLAGSKTPSYSTPVNPISYPQPHGSFSGSSRSFPKMAQRRFQIDFPRVPQAHDVIGGRRLLCDTGPNYSETNPTNRR